MGPTKAETGTRSGKPTETDLSWSGLLAAYRAEPNEHWSGLLVERLGPWLTRARQRLIAVPPYLDDEDVAQQLVLEVLRVAARWHPRCEDCWVARKLVQAAERRVRMGLTRARSLQAIALDERLPAPAGAEPESVFETPVGLASAEDLRVLYRARVLGEPVAALAREAGLTPRQMRRRVWAARKRARTPVAATGFDKA
jgi:hypothetical protein